MAFNYINLHVTENNFDTKIFPFLDNGFKLYFCAELSCEGRVLGNHVKNKK